MENIKPKHYSKMRLKILYLILLAFFVYACNRQTKKNETLTQSENSMIEKFDYIEYERRINNAPMEGNYYFKLDGTFVEEMLGSNNEYAIRRETPPKPSFVKIYKEFYMNGNIKSKETRFGEYTKVDISLYYDEQGNITKKVDENRKFSKIKPEDILRFLEEKKRINLETGEGVFGEKSKFLFEVVYNEDKDIWFVTIPQGRYYTALEMDEIMKNWDIGEPSEWKQIEYEIDGKTGKVISSDE